MKLLQTPYFPICFPGGAWTHAPPVAVARGGDTPHCSNAQKPSSTLFLQLQKASLAILVDFGVYF
jgi:hypothetical protein